MRQKSRQKLSPLEKMIKSIIPNNQFYITPLVKEFTEPSKEVNLLYYGSFREEVTAINSIISEEPFLIETTPTLFSHIAPGQIAYFHGFEIRFATSLFLTEYKLFLSLYYPQAYFSMIHFKNLIPDQEGFNLLVSFDGGKTYPLIKNVPNYGDMGDIERNGFYAPDTVDCTDVKLQTLDAQITSNVFHVKDYVAPSLFFALNQINQDPPRYGCVLPDGYPLNRNFMLQSSLDAGLTWQNIRAILASEFLDFGAYSNIRLSVLDTINNIRSNVQEIGNVAPPPPPYEATQFIFVSLLNTERSRTEPVYVDYLDEFYQQQRTTLGSATDVPTYIYARSIVAYVNCVPLSSDEIPEVIVRTPLLTSSHFIFTTDVTGYYVVSKPSFDRVVFAVAGQETTFSFGALNMFNFDIKHIPSQTVFHFSHNGTAMNG